MNGERKRHSHYLRPSKSVAVPSIQVALSIIPSTSTADSTGRVSTQGVAAWSAVAWGEGLGRSANWPIGSGVDRQSFWDWLPRACRKGRCTWVWQLGACHGLTLLDFWDMLTLGLWKLDGFDPTGTAEQGKEKRKPNAGMCVIEDTPTIIQSRPVGGPGMVKWVDVGNLGVDDWQSISGDTGIDCTPLQADHPDVYTPDAMPAWRASALRRWVESYQQLCLDLDLGGIRHTAAAQSWHGWRHTYMQTPCLCHNDPVATLIETESLAAGRCEAFRLGLVDGPIYHVDASSHYPACAVSESLPVRLCGTGVLSIDDYCEMRELGWGIIARCTVECPGQFLPHKGQWITTFPVGRWRATLCGPELDLAVANGWVKDIGLAAWYEMMRPFNRFIATLWLERRRCDVEGLVARQSAVKRLLNSLIGKCAQRSFRWVDHEHPTPFSPFEVWQGEHPETGETCRWRSIAWHTQFEQVNGQADDSLPAIASWVYSVARLRLLHWIEIAGWENVLYVDTDSLFLRQEGFNNLLTRGEIRPGELGGLSVRHVATDLDIRGFKHYTMDGVVTCSGVPKSATMSAGGDWSFWIPETVKGELRRNKAPQAKVHGYRMPDVRAYRHGMAQRDGSVTPLRVWEV